MATASFPRNNFRSHRQQRGVATLLVTLVVLVILTIIVLASSNVALFEQKTATNSSRQQLTQQAAEYSLGVSEEFFKANTASLIVSWLPSGSAPHWQPCTTAVTSGQIDPCLAESDPTRRNQLYRYNFNSTTNVNFDALLPATTSTELGRLDTAGGSVFTVTTDSVTALLCRLDISNPAAPTCRANPSIPGLYAITLVSTSAIAGENASSQVKDTIAAYRTFGGPNAPPIVASGTMDGLGNQTIVTNPNAGGFGLPVSVWSPCQVDIDKGAVIAPVAPCTAANNGNGSVSTCYVEDYLDGKPLSDLLLSTGCATTGNPCKCDTEVLSGGGNVKQEGIDILDRDGNRGNPDMTFFPREPWDNPNDSLDDSLFEFTFQQESTTEGATVTDQTCTGGPTGFTTDCAMVALITKMKAKVVACNALGPTTTGVVLVLGNCALPNSNVGSPDKPVILVVAGDADDGQVNSFFGILFVYSANNSATFSSNGGNFFGSVIVQGKVTGQGGANFVYSDTIVQNLNNLPAFVHFARLPGSWLDSQIAF